MRGRPVLASVLVPTPVLALVWLCAAVLVSAGGCATADTPASPQPSRPDANPGPGPGPGPTCMPGCSDGVQRVCSPVEMELDCTLGCDDGGFSCRRLVPSNGAVSAQLEGVSGLLGAASGEVVALSTDDGSIRVESGDLGSRDVRGAGEGVIGGIGFYPLGQGGAVMAVSELAMAPNSTLRIDGQRHLILLVETTATIDGVIDVSARPCVGDVDPAVARCGGPGGGTGALVSVDQATGCAPGGNGSGQDGAVDETGGGGGGLGSDGASGGVGADGTQPGVGGAIAGSCPGAAVVPLTGGSGGGAGGISNADGEGGGAGGGGGGAIQISAFERIAIGAGAEPGRAGIDAGGGGAAPGTLTTGGGGGGSGGAIVLEAPTVLLSAAVLAANGGGGGGSSSAGEIPDIVGTAGADGGFDDAQAIGGTGVHDGGLGGAALGAATAGSGDGDGTGGGGGGVGLIRLNVPEAGLTIDAAVISPAHTRADPTSQ